MQPCSIMFRGTTFLFIGAVTPTSGYQSFKLLAGLLRLVVVHSSRRFGDSYFVSAIIWDNILVSGILL